MNDSTKQIAYRLRKVAKRTSEQDSDHSLFVDAADALEAAERIIVERTKQRDELFDLADKHITERDALTEQLAAAQATIGRARGWLTSGQALEDRIGSAIYELDSAPTDALEAVKAAAWDECLDEIEAAGINTMQAREGNPYRAASSTPGEVESRG